jgi:hypothetical protein
MWITPLPPTLKALGEGSHGSTLNGNYEPTRLSSGWKSTAEAVLKLMMESDVDGLIGAGRHERAEQRTTWRNGYRDRSLDTRLGTLNLKVPKLRQGSYFPGFLEARKTSEQALVAVIGAVLFEQNDEWQTSSRYMMVEAFAQIDKEEVDPIRSIAMKAT